jgi:hypothetical protein
LILQTFRGRPEALLAVLERFDQAVSVEMFLSLSMFAPVSFVAVRLAPVAQSSGAGSRTEPEAKEQTGGHETAGMAESLPTRART